VFTLRKDEAVSSYNGFGENLEKASASIFRTEFGVPRGEACLHAKGERGIRIVLAKTKRSD